MADTTLAPPSGALDTSKAYTARFKTEKGDIVVELYADRAPLTVENFVNLARAGFYEDFEPNLIGAQRVNNMIHRGYIEWAGFTIGKAGTNFTYWDQDDVISAIDRGLVAVAIRPTGRLAGHWEVALDEEPAIPLPPVAYVLRGELPCDVLRTGQRVDVPIAFCDHEAAVGQQPAVPKRRQRERDPARDARLHCCHAATPGSID